MKNIEEGLHRIHAKSNPDSSAMESTSSVAPQDLPKPFASINFVAINSPADEAVRPYFYRIFLAKLIVTRFRKRDLILWKKISLDFCYNLNNIFLRTIYFYLGTSGLISPLILKLWGASLCRNFQIFFLYPFEKMRGIFSREMRSLFTDPISILLMKKSLKKSFLDRKEMSSKNFWVLKRMKKVIIK